MTTYSTQADAVRAHLIAGKSITPGSALLVYGISRLAVAIDALRRSGMEIDMTLKTDEVGKRYGEYKIRRSIAIGSRVQVQRGHGYGLPSWVLKTSAARVVGLVKDCAYVQFIRGDRSEVLSLNCKELVNVA